MTIECTGPHCHPPGWIRITLIAAGIYNIVFGIWSVLWPHLWFRWSGLPEPEYLILWQALGMIVGVYGFGYLIASGNPIHHWPIIFVGFLGKLLGPLGFLWAVSQGELPLSAGWILLTNDLIWWIPFAMILWVVVQAHTGRPPGRELPYTIEEAANHYKLSSGETLAEASQRQPLALVFLRHFGCTFTKQLLQHLQQIKADTDSRGGRLVLVHMMERGQGRTYLRDHDNVARIADPHCELYRAFGLGKGGFWELLGPKVWLHAFINLFHGCAQTQIIGDGLQMPGTFLFQDGEVVSAQPAKSAADLPNVQKLFATTEMAGANREA